jgi:hypothetical protein
MAGVLSNMKTTLILTLAMVFTGAILPAQQKTPVVNKRQANQQKRIAAGVADGSLTKPEARRLQAQQRELRRDVRQDKRDGGGLTTAERRDARQEAREQSRKIAKQRNDGQTRPQ